MKCLKVIVAALCIAAATAKNCGPNIGKCKHGLCCSKHGYCGSTIEYCGTGCQSEFGKCNSSSKKTTTTTKKVTKVTKKTTTTKKITKTTKKAATTKASEKISTNGKCGPAYGICPNGKCCSKYGYCGVTSQYCGAGCQSEFGKCGSADVKTTTTKKTTTTTKKVTKKTTTTKGVTPNPNKNTVPFKFYYECKNKNQWALTFDDGPYKFDEDLLDLLKKYNVKATFFLNGDNVMDITSSKGERIVKRMYNEGHVIGSHTWKHADLDTLSASGIEEQMTKLEKVLLQYIGKKPAFMRLPYGSGTGNSTVKKTLQKLGYTAGFMWNVDTKDWKYTGEVNYALARFKEKMGKPILSLNHCFYHNISQKTLLTLIEKEIIYMKKQGYTPVTADQCVGLPAYQ